MASARYRAEPRFELEPISQEADALLSEPRRTIEQNSIKIFKKTYYDPGVQHRPGPEREDNNQWKPLRNN